ncbi:MAG TPA: hypothetical protein PKD67_10490 [Ignavibacteriaceae bacterium]|nr:hypothetical protein [Ignavibacteriaceae bacterium]
MNWKNYFILTLLLAIAALCNSQMDIIQFNPSRAWFSGWWIAANWQQSWIQKYLFGWTVDGWHLCKILFLTSLLSMVGYMIKLTKRQKWYFTFIYTIILLMAWGLLFEVFYIL